MALDEPEEDESSHPVNGIDVLIREPIVDMVENTTIDYIYQSGDEGFVLMGQDDNC
jgi:Fe-S cluster assembly iron-binding protein IscA